MPGIATGDTDMHNESIGPPRYRMNNDAAQILG